MSQTLSQDLKIKANAIPISSHTFSKHQSSINQANALTRITSSYYTHSPPEKAFPVTTTPHSIRQHISTRPNAAKQTLAAWIKAAVGNVSDKTYTKI